MSAWWCHICVTLHVVMMLSQTCQEIKIADLKERSNSNCPTNSSLFPCPGPRVSTDPCCWPVPPCHTVCHSLPASCSILYLPCMSRQTASDPSGTACRYLTRNSEIVCRYFSRNSEIVCRYLSRNSEKSDLQWPQKTFTCYSTISLVLLKKQFKNGMVITFGIATAG